MSKRTLIPLLAVALIILAIGSASATSTWYGAFSTTYPGSTTLTTFGCQTCHVPSGPPGLNPYGSAYAAAGHNFKTIESADSDGDGSTNITEINAGTNPGDPASKPATPPPPAACTYTYSAWGACQSNGTQTRTVVSSSPAGCVGTPVLSQACTYVPPVTACTSWTYSAWSACQSNNTQTRTVTSSSPAGCTGNPPASQLTQACTYVPPVTACTSWTYSAWSACQSNNTQTRTVTSSSPAGCTGNPPASQLTQACTYVPPTTACTSYTYTLGACQSNGTAPVTSYVGIPAGCSGGVAPATTQPCTYVPPTPPPTTGSMPAPTSEQTFTYDAVAAPVLNSDPAAAKPIGIGPAASGGDTLDLSVGVGPFAVPMDLSLVIYSPSLDAFDLFYFLNNTQVVRMTDALRAEEERTPDISMQRGGEDEHESEARTQRKYSRLVLWKATVTSINEAILSAPLADLPSGVYTIILTATVPDGAGDDDAFYRWVTQLVVPKHSDGRHDD